MKLILLALRSLTRFRLYSVINVLGLALSLACVITLSRYIYQETTVDRFHTRLERLYVTTLQEQNSPIVSFAGDSNFNNEPDYKNPLEDIAVEQSTTYNPMFGQELFHNEHKYIADILAVDTVFLQILDFPIAVGNRQTLLQKPDGAVITRAFAEKVFGKENPIGKNVSFTFGKPVTIEGIIDNLPGKSTLHFDLLISRAMQTHWSIMPQSIALLYAGSDIREVNKRLEPYMYMKAWDQYQHYQFFPMSKLYFDRTVYAYNNLFIQGNRTNIQVLSVVLFLILFIGFVNFTNTYAVQIQKRAREFGMKKVLGARPFQLFGQIYLENVTLVGSALFLAWSIVECTQEYLERQWGISQADNWEVHAGLLFAILFLLPVLTAAYPFFKYQYAVPVKTLQSVGRGGTSVVSRNALLVVQYALSIGLIIVSLYFVKQLRFMLNYDNGYRTEDIIQVQFLRQNCSDDYEEETISQWTRHREINNLITDKMNASPLFSEWTYGTCPYEYGEPMLQFECNGKKELVLIDFITGTYMKLFGLQTVEGRALNDSIDHFGSYDLIMNETAKRLFGITDITHDKLQPEKRLWFGAGMGDMSQNPAYNIIGVVKDFQVGHLSKAIPPLVYTASDAYPYDRLCAHIVPGQQQEAIRFLRELHEETVGGEFTYTFVADELRKLYDEDRKITNIYTAFAAIAILISSLGLFGLSLFDVQQRYNEIAIRKVNGATTADVMRMMLRKYYRLLLLAFVIAVPLTWFAIHRYMENFAHRTTLSWWLFLVALLLTASIAILTLIWQIGRAARSNPADAIQSE